MYVLAASFFFCIHTVHPMHARFSSFKFAHFCFRIFSASSQRRIYPAVSFSLSLSSPASMTSVSFPTCTTTATALPTFNAG